MLLLAKFFLDAAIWLCVRFKSSILGLLTDIPGFLFFEFLLAIRLIVKTTLPIGSILAVAATGEQEQCTGTQKFNARVAELVDALDLGSSSGNRVGVQVSPLAPLVNNDMRLFSNAFCLCDI